MVINWELEKFTGFDHAEKSLKQTWNGLWELEN